MRTLVLSMAPWKHATRTRKAALAYASEGPTTFLAPQGVGRTGKWDEAGRTHVDGVDVVHTKVRPVRLEATRRAMALNLLTSYGPALARMAATAMRREADVVHVTGAPLVPLALAHSRRFGSRIVLDVNERPASVSAPGSLFGALARVEPALLRRARDRATLTTVVTQGHADLLREVHGWASPIVVVRNAPLAGSRVPWQSLPEAPTRIVTVGTIFERRGFEIIVDAVGICARRGLRVPVDIYGSGRPEYVGSVRARIRERGVSDLVTVHPAVDRGEVPTTYQRGHFGLAFYEPVDPGNDSLSNKIIECVSAGRPVLAGDLPENRRFVSETGCGWLTALDAHSVADSIEWIVRGEDLATMAERCREVATTLTWDAEFSQVIHTLRMDVDKDSADES